jgi:hypothetical protein
MLCFISCIKTPQVEPAVYEFEAIDSFDLVLDKTDRTYLPFPNQLIELDGSNVLLLNIGRRKISFYDIDKGVKVHEINIDSTMFLDSFYYINKDSILITYLITNQQEQFSNPSSFRMINIKGETKSVYGYDIDLEDVKSKGYSFENLLPQLTFTGIPVCGDKVFFTTWADHIGDIGTSEFFQNPFPFGLMFDLETQKYVVSKHHKYPNVIEGVYYPSSFSVIHCSVSDNDLPLYRYNYSSDVFEWDYKNDEIVRHSFKSRLIDSIMPSKEPTRYADNVLEAYYGGVKYDKINQLYYGELYFNENFYGSMQHAIIIADKDFNYLGEIYNNLNWPCFANEKGLVELSFKNDSVIGINYLKLVKTNRNFDDYIDSCRNDLHKKKKAVNDYKEAMNAGNNTVLNFLKSKIKIEAKDFKIITFYANEGCMGCSEVVYNEIKNNREYFENSPFYIVVSAGSMSEAITELSIYELEDFANLAIDTTNVLKRLAGTKGLLNPRITIVKNDVVSLDSIYQSNAIVKELIPQMFDSFPIIEGDYVIVVEQ